VDQVDEEVIRQVAMKLRGAPGPSGLPTDLVRSLIAERDRPSARKLRRALARFTRLIMSTPMDKGDLESFTVARLVALAKDDVGGIRPIGIGEAWRRLCLKTVGKVTKEKVMDACGVRQVCAGQPTGCEAAAHWMRGQAEKRETEMILLVDASNAFNAADRPRLLRSVSQRAPSLGTTARNIYMHGSDLVLADGTRLRSRQGTTQGCPIAMQCFALSTLDLIEQSRAEGLQQEWYADDSGGVGTVRGACKWFEALLRRGGDFGYHVNAKKTVAIVKRSAKKEFEEVFKKRLDPRTYGEITLVVMEDMEDDELDTKETCEDALKWGSRYLGAGLGGRKFREAYVKEKVKGWTGMLGRLVEVAKIDPQIAYSLLVHGTIPRWKFLMRTTPSEPAWFQPMEDIISGPLSEALINHKAEGALRERIALPCRHGGLAILNPTRMAKEEYAASRKVTQALVEMIVKDEQKEGWMDVIKSVGARVELRKSREAEYEKKRVELLKDLVGRDRHAFGEAAGRGKGGVLTAVPTELVGTAMSAVAWRVNVQLRLGLVPKELPTRCPDCRKANPIDHALGDGKDGGCGGARIRRHNEVGEFVLRSAEKAGYVVPSCRNPLVGKIDRKDLDTKCDGIIRGFMAPQRETWVDAVVSDTGAPSHRNQPAEKTLEQAANKKKEKHHTRVMICHNADFLEIACSVYGSMAFNCQQTIKRIAERMVEKSAAKGSSDRSQVLHLMRARFQAAVWRATASCVVGRKGTAWRKGRKEDDDEEDDHDELEVAAAGGAGDNVPWLLVAGDARVGFEGL
jgi:hypothetical protein